ncbi:protein ALTERED PHOSPHATE STARVATION RESPONSE 1-like [Impatiens glandulifera]|uniref:protein ALTERED PHOSPHATE STARVATION RESPONSE 1-like n=1 Tax=Impatiens glandulifera TaxID=253017 RepID=UPI001FB08545|nr:protein ALTERED PHOSPHATE STARVATION RESPONSE 1-like [Impatiens glandulifera]
MGCVASKLEEEEVVSICRERKTQLKLAVDRRYALAEAHCRYFRALYGVAAALNLFVARHSSPSSPFLITLPPPSSSSPPSSPTKENMVSNPLFLQQTPSEPIQKAIGCETFRSTTSDGSSEQDIEEKVTLHREEEEEGPQCGYFYMQMPTQMPSPKQDYGWDFFNPFDEMRPEMISGYRRNSDEDVRLVREEEGIPELEEEGENTNEEEEDANNVVQEQVKKNVEKECDGSQAVKVVEDDVSQAEQNGLTVVDSQESGRELLEALKDIEDHFIRAYDSGKEVSRMLEATRFHMQPDLEETKDNSSKLIQAITWRSISRSSSSKSLVASSSRSSSWNEFNNDLFDDDYGGMDSGSHSFTLGRLYAWEKKLFEEVKSGDSTRKLYEKKCSQLRNHDARGDDEICVDKTKVAVKDLYSRIVVAIRRAESISNKIEKLRDEELQPQIVELLKGLMRNWKILLESHEIQSKIINEVKSYNCPTYGKFCNNSHRLATLQLETELQNWKTCLMQYMVGQKAYVEALKGWLSLFIAPEVEFYSRGRSSSRLCGVQRGPPLLSLCNDWLTRVGNLPNKAVAYSMRSFGKDLRALWVQQGDEQQQKRKADRLAKELDRKIVLFQKMEQRIMSEPKLLEFYPSQEPFEQHDDLLGEKKDMLDGFRRRVDEEKEKHQNCMQETRRITVNGFQTGLGGIFQSLTEFSRATLRMYEDILSHGMDNEKDEKTGCIEGSQNEGGST